MRARGIAGHSMGGHGAIKLAMLYPDRFGIAYGLNSSVLGWGGDLSPDKPARPVSGQGVVPEQGGSSLTRPPPPGVPASVATGLRAWLTSESPTSRAQARAAALYHGWLGLRANRLAMLGLAILVALGVVALLAPVLAPHSPFAQDLGNRLKPPGTAGHPLGTDSLGRDILSRLIHGSRITFYIVALIAPLAGLLVGTVAGYVGGWIDAILMRLTDIFLAFPRLVLALAFVAALGAGIENAVLAIALTAWPPYARIARAETLSIRRSDYISAVRLQGAGAIRIITRHIWPLCIASLIVRMTLDMAGIILAAAGLGFLGLGARPPSPEWGAIDLRAEQGLTYLMVSHDLAVVGHLCQRVAVMERGVIVEVLDVAALRALRATHPYTRRLLESSLGHLPTLETAAD